MAEGVFIVLEGADGSGKTRQNQHLVARLEGHGRATHATAEPTRGPIGEFVRRGLRGEISLSARAMALLFAADRAEHSEHEIVPAIERGAVVVCDRYDLSNVVYRAAEQRVIRCSRCGWDGDEAPWKLDTIGNTKRRRCPSCNAVESFIWPRFSAIQWAQAISRGIRRPDLTVVLDVSVEVGVARRAARGGGVERYDDTTMQGRVVELYRRAAELLPGERVVIVDGDGAEVVVADRVWAAVENSGVLA